MKRKNCLGVALCLSLAACAPIQEQQQEPLHEQAAAQAPAPWAMPDALDLLSRYEVGLDARTRDKLSAVARKAARPGGTLHTADLDLNGDGEVTRKEVQFVLSWQPEQLRQEGLYRLETRPKMLPNRLISGMVQIHVNNPEMVSDPGLLFDSRRLKGRGALTLGQRDQQRFELFTYANYLPLRQKHASKPGPDGQTLSAAWYAILVHNPIENEPVTLTIAGTGHLNQANRAHASRMLTQLPREADAGRRAAASERINHPTRSNDADLQYRMLNPERHELKKAITIAPGRAMLLYTRLPMQSGLQDYRGQYQFQVQDSGLIWPLQLQAAVLTKLPTSTSAEAGILADIDPADFAPAIKSQLAAFVEPGPAGQIEHLRQASDLSSPRALAAEMWLRQLPKLRRINYDFRALRNRLSGDLAQLPNWLETQTKQIAGLRQYLLRSRQTAESVFAPYLSDSEFKAYIARGEALARDLERAPAFDENLLARMRGWNAEIKMFQRVLLAPDTATGQRSTPEIKALLGAFVAPLWDTLFTLGRVNGVVRGNLISSTLPSDELIFGPEDRSREWNYVFNTNPYTTGGAEASAKSTPFSLVDAAGILKQSANIKSPPTVSYGNYGLRYRIEGKLKNESSTPMPFDIRIGSPDELGHVDWRSLFDQTDTLLGESSTRFTGTLRLTLAPQDQPAQVHEYSLIHGRVQAPESLLARVGQLDPGMEIKVTVELVIPTNSTAPQLLQFHAGEAVRTQG